MATAVTGRLLSNALGLSTYSHISMESPSISALQRREEIYGSYNGPRKSFYRPRCISLRKATGMARSEVTWSLHCSEILRMSGMKQNRLLQYLHLRGFGRLWHRTEHGNCGDASDNGV